MYALFLPSAHNFISSVEEKVKVEERIISVTTGPLTPRRLGSPAWMALVWGPRLGRHFTSKEAASEHSFHLRVGLFSVLDAGTRGAILTERDEWLAARELRLGRLSGALDLGAWGGEVVHFLRDQIRSERKWISHLKRKLGRQGP